MRSVSCCLEDQYPAKTTLLIVVIGYNSGEPSSLEHRNIRSRAEQSVHDAAAHSQRLRAIAAAVKLETRSRFESEAKSSARIKMVKFLKEWIVSILHSRPLNA